MARADLGSREHQRFRPAAGPTTRPLRRDGDRRSSDANSTHATTVRPFRAENRRARCALGRHCCCRQPSAASGRSRGLFSRARAARRPPLAPGFASAKDHLSAARASAELQPGGAKLHLSIAQAAKLLRSLRPGTVVDVERKQIACELLEDWRWLHKRIPDVVQRIRDALAATAARSASCTTSATLALRRSSRSSVTCAGFPPAGFCRVQWHRAAGRLLQ